MSKQLKQLDSNSISDFETIMTEKGFFKTDKTQAHEDLKRIKLKNPRRLNCRLLYFNYSNKTETHSVKVFIRVPYNDFGDRILLLSLFFKQTAPFYLNSQVHHILKGDESFENLMQHLSIAKERVDDQLSPESKDFLKNQKEIENSRIRNGSKKALNRRIYKNNADAHQKKHKVTIAVR